MLDAEFGHTFEGISDGWGCATFLDRKALEDEQSGFLHDGWITLTAWVSVQRQREEPLDPQSGPRTSSQRCEDDGPKCIFCIAKVQTAGVLHGNSYVHVRCSAFPEKVLNVGRTSATA